MKRHSRAGTRWGALVERAREVLGVDQEAWWVVETVAGRDRAELVADLDQPAPAHCVARFEDLLERRLAGEPLQYVLGSWSFRGLDLIVDRRVLIPRPETEVVAGLAIEEIERRGGGLVADLGTGSGAIALAVAAECWPEVEVWATDASDGAVAVASANVAGLGRRATGVRLATGSWFDALPAATAGTFDVIVSNPPYVADRDALPPVVADWEPDLALRAGSDGLDAVREIVSGAPRWLAPGGILVVEHAPAQVDAVRSLAAAAGLVAISTVADLGGRARCLRAARA